MKKEAIDKFTRHKRKIQVVVGLAMFIVGFLIFWKFLQKPLTDKQFELCEQVAQDVFENLSNTITSSNFFVRVTDDFSVQVITNKSSVMVCSQSLYHCGDQVVVNLENDTFIPERKNGILSAAFVSILFGIVLFIVGFLIVNKIYEFIKKSS